MNYEVKYDNDDIIYCSIGFKPQEIEMIGHKNDHSIEEAFFQALRMSKDTYFQEGTFYMFSSTSFQIKVIYTDSNSFTGCNQYNTIEKIRATERIRFYKNSPPTQNKVPIWLQPTGDSEFERTTYFLKNRWVNSCTLHHLS